MEKLITSLVILVVLVAVLLGLIVLDATVLQYTVNRLDLAELANGYLNTDIDTHMPFALSVAVILVLSFVSYSPARTMHTRRFNQLWHATFDDHNEFYDDLDDPEIRKLFNGLQDLGRSMYNTGSAYLVLVGTIELIVRSGIF